MEEINVKTGKPIVPYPRKPAIDKRRNKDKMLKALQAYCDKMRWACRSRRENPHRYAENTSLAGQESAYSEISYMLSEIMAKGK
jgi:hypothetical protein